MRRPTTASCSRSTWPGPCWIPDYLTSASPTWPAEYPSDFQFWVGGLPARLGHIVEAVGGVDHYFVRSRSLLDFMVREASDPRGLALAQRDPFEE